jgi:hypothetical protein
LGHHALRRNDEHATGSPTDQQFGQENADLYGLSKSDSIRNQNTLPRLLQSLPRGIELVGQIVNRRGVTQPERIPDDW